MVVEVRRWDRRGVGVDDGCNSSRDSSGGGGTVRH